MTSNGRVQGLDVLRGVAVGLVLLCHAWPGVFPGAGIVGVTVFFALSGYLITGLLLRDARRFDRLRLGRFYAHRFFRLYPALVTVLVVFSAVALAAQLHPVRQLLKSAVVGLCYVADLPSGHLAPVPALAHLWTLAVEEQFYLVWPWVVLLGVRHGRLGTYVSAAAAVVVAVSIAVPVALPALVPLSTHQVYQSPSSWAITLVMGAAAQVHRDRLAALLGRPWPCAVALAALLALCFVPGADQHVVLILALGPVVAAAAVVVLFTAEQHATVGPALRPLLALGTISYAAYLWNYPITLWLPPVDHTTMPLGWGLLSVLLTIAAATASWFTAEAVGRSLRARYDARRAAAPLPVLVPASVR